MVQYTYINTEIILQLTVRERENMTAFDGILISAFVTFVGIIVGAIFDKIGLKKGATICLCVLVVLIIIAFLLGWESTIIDFFKGTDGATSTSEPTPAPTPTSTPEPTPDIIEKLGDAPSSSDFEIVWTETFTEPADFAYLPNYEVKYVKSSKGYGVFFYYAPIGTDEYRRGIDLLEGTEVVVLAEQNGFSCVIYYKQSSGHYHAGWVNSKWLVDKY